MNCRPGLFYLAAIFLFTVTLQAQESSMTLEDTLQTAKENSLGLYTAEKTLGTARRNYANRGNAFYPSIQASAGLSRSNSSTTATGLVPVSPAGNGVYDQVMQYEKETSPVSLSAGLSASLTLNPAIGDGIKYLRKALDSAGLEREEAEKALERDVKVSFYNLLYTDGSIQLTRQSMEILKGEYELALTDFRNGRISELELLNTQVAYKNMEPTLARQLTSYRELRSQFFLLLGIEGDDSIRLEGTIEVPADLDSLAPAEADLNSHFQVAALDNTIARTEISRKSTFHEGFYPSLSLTASLSPVVSDPFSAETWDTGVTEPWTDNGSVSLSVSIPLDSWLPGSSVRTSLKEQENTLDTLRKQRIHTLQSVSEEVSLLYENLEDSLLNIESLELSVQVARRAWELTEEGYRKGSIEFLDLKEAENDLNSARQNLLAEKLSLLTTLFDLEYALNSSTDKLLSPAK
jgi:outer membrane protein TolC